MAGHIATAARTDWCTPTWILDWVREVLGSIQLDPCSNGESLVRADVEWFGPPDTDGLVAEWAAKTIFVNPPFGTTHRHKVTKLVAEAEEWKKLSKSERLEYDSVPLIRWVERCWEAHQHGSEVILLSPANVDTAVWQRIIFPTADAICFLEGRVTFVGAPACAPMPIALSYWGERARRFERAFRSVGQVIYLPKTPRAREVE